MNADALITFTTAMLAILNPIGNVAVYAGMVGGRTPGERRAIAVRSSIAIAIILVFTIWAGEFVLKVFGIGIPSLQVSGGLIIALISLSMLHSNQSEIHDTNDSDDAATSERDIAIVPLAMPMVAGPGAMVTVIVATHQHSGVAANLAMSAVCGALAALICAGFLAAGPVTRILGSKGMDVVTKLMGMILLAIAAGMLAAGLKGLLPGLAGASGGI